MHWADQMVVYPEMNVKPVMNSTTQLTTEISQKVKVIYFSKDSQTIEQPKKETVNAKVSRLDTLVLS